MYTKISEIISSENHKKDENLKFPFFERVPFLDKSSQDLMSVNCLKLNKQNRGA